MGMREIQETRRLRLKNLLEEEGRGSQARLADAIDTNASFISQLVNGYKTISDELAHKIEAALGLPDGGLDLEPLGADVHPWGVAEDLPEDHFLIPRIDVRSSGGNGNRIEEAPEKGQPQAFRREWIESRGYKPGALASLTNKGDSMEPVLPDGAAIVVDTSHRAIHDGKLYVVRYNDEIRTKVLYTRPGGGLTIASYNPQYQPIHLTPEEAEWVEILGRVIWSAAEH